MDDLVEWEDYDWDQWMRNCKKPERIPDPISAAQLINQVPLPLSVKSLKCFKIASRMVSYYESVSFDLTGPNLLCTLLDNYEIQRKTMAKKSKQSSSDVPKLGKNKIVAKWNDFITVHSGQLFGARKSTI